MDDFEREDFSESNDSKFHDENIVSTHEVQYNPVNYSKMNDDSNKKGISVGIKVFAVVMAAVLALTGAIGVGYLIGTYKALNGQNKDVDLNLEARPNTKDQLTAAQVYNQLNESIVGIRVYNSEKKFADASGVIYTENGYIVTNDHIYSEIPNAMFKIYMHDGTEYDAYYVAGDSISDLAVLKINTDAKFKVPSFGDSRQIVCGENVVAIGRQNDATDNTSITYGIVSLPKCRMKTAFNYSTSLIQTDSAINPGSSGGALVNMYGQIIGITASKLAGVQYDSITFAIPTTTLKRVVEELIKYGKVTNRAKLGITYTEINSVLAGLNDVSYTGLLIDEVSKDSDAYGKVSEGDIITHVNGNAILHDDYILDIIEECYAGDKIELTILSVNGSVNTYEVELKANVGESSYIVTQ